MVKPSFLGGGWIAVFYGDEHRDIVQLGIIPQISGKVEENPPGRGSCRECPIQGVYPAEADLRASSFKMRQWIRSVVSFQIGVAQRHLIKEFVKISKAGGYPIVDM